MFKLAYFKHLKETALALSRVKHIPSKAALFTYIILCI